MIWQFIFLFFNVLWIKLFLYFLQYFFNNSYFFYSNWDGCFLGWLLLTQEIGCLDNPYFTYWLPKRPVFSFPLTLTQLVRLPMVTYPSLCCPCVTYRTLCHAIGHQVLPTQPLPRKAEDFPRGDRYFKHVPPFTHLLYFSPKELYMVGFIYTL